jgi:hypothetical protein
MLICRAYIYEKRSMSMYEWKIDRSQYVKYEHSFYFRIGQFE